MGEHTGPADALMWLQFVALVSLMALICVGVGPLVRHASPPMPPKG